GAFALWQTLQRPHLDPPTAATACLVAIELVLTVTFLSLTGGFSSPFVLTPGVALVLAGYVFSERRVMTVVYVGVGAIAATAVLGQSTTDSVHTTALIGAVYILCGALGAFVRHVIVEITRRHLDAIHQVSRMTRANELLVTLHGVARSLPASLDLT